MIYLFSLHEVWLLKLFSHWTKQVIFETLRAHSRCQKQNTIFPSLCMLSVINPKPPRGTWVPLAQQRLQTGKCKRESSRLRTHHPCSTAAARSFLPPVYLLELVFPVYWYPVMLLCCSEIAATKCPEGMLIAKACGPCGGPNVCPSTQATSSLRH